MSGENIELVGGPWDGRRQPWATGRETFEIAILPFNRIRPIDYEDYQTTRRDVRKGTYRRTDRRTVKGLTIFRWEG